MCYFFLFVRADRGLPASAAKKNGSRHQEKKGVPEHKRMLPFNASESVDAFRETDSAFGEWSEGLESESKGANYSFAEDTTSTSFGQYWGALLGDVATQPQGPLFDDIATRKMETGKEDEAMTLYNLRLIEGGMYDRLRRALASKHRRQPWLASLVSRAVGELGKRDVTPVLADIRDIVAEIAEEETGGVFATTTETTGASETETLGGDVCDRIPAHERSKYPYCSPSGNELTRDILELVRMLSNNSSAPSIAAALRTRGYAPHELRSAATRFVEGSKHLFKTNRLFAKGGDATKVFEAIMELVQNKDFVQHMVQLMAMHLPPDYPWSSEQILHVSKWWIMHYISLVRPQLVHAVIECPDSDVRKCKLAGLSLGNSSVPVALWRGSSLTVADDTVSVDARGTYFTELTKSKKWGYACALFRSLVEELKEARPGVGRFGKLTAEQRRKLRAAADKAEKTWRNDTQDFKQELFVLGTSSTLVSHVLDTRPAGTDNVLFDDTKDTLRYNNKRIKHLIVHGRRWFYTSDSSDTTHKSVLAHDTKWTEPTADDRHACDRWKTEIKDASKQIRDTKWVSPLVAARHPQFNGAVFVGFVGLASHLQHYDNVSASRERIEAPATFKLTLNARLFMTPQHIADLVSDVKGSEQFTPQDLIFGGFFRYGLNLARYSDFQQSKHELATYYGLKPEGVSRLFAFHENARKLLLKIPTIARNAHVLLQEPNVAGKTGWCRSESERYATAAAMTALLHIGLGNVEGKGSVGATGTPKDPLQNYINVASEFFELAHEFGVENLAESTFVTDTKIEPDVKTFYDETTDNDFYGESRDDSLSAVDQATDEWMKRLKRVFDDTEETY